MRRAKGQARLVVICERANAQRPTDFADHIRHRRRFNPGHPRQLCWQACGAYASCRALPGLARQATGWERLASVFL